MKTLEEMKRDIALEYYLQYNIYPSVVFCFDMAKEAIFAVNAGEGDTMVAVPQTMTINGKEEMTANEVIEMFNLDFFLDEREE